MPITGYHVLTATTPDNTNGEIKPSHWNSGHTFTLNAVGEEISGAFSNANNLSFGMSGTKLTASGGFLTTAANSTHSHGNPTLALTNLTGTTASASNGLTISLSALDGQFSAGVSTGGNTAGATGVTGTRIVYVGSNNISLSQTTGAAGATISIIGASTSAQQTGISGMIVSDATYTSGTVSFSNQNGVTIGSSVNGASQYVRLSVATSYAASNHSHGNPTLNLTNLSGTTASNSAGLTLSLSANAPGAATLTVSAVGNTTVNSSGTWANAVSARAYGALSIGTSNGSLLFSTPDTVEYTYLSVGNSNLGNTAGDTGVFSQRLVIVGSNNITLSGSSNGGSATISIVGAGGVGPAAIYDGAASISTGTIRFTNANGVTFTINGQTISGSVNTSYAASNHSHGNPTLALTNLTGTTASASNGLTLSLSAQAPQTGLSGMIVSDATYTSGTVSFSNQNGVTIGSSVNGASQYIRLSVNTSYRASNDGLGLNTAGTNVTWTANSSGLSINAAGYAGTATALTGAIAATVNSGGVSITVPATSSIVGTSGMSISSNGSTFSVQPVVVSSWGNIGQLQVAGTAQGNSLVSIQPISLEWPLAFSNVLVPMSVSVGSAGNNSTAYLDVSVSGVLYTRNASTLSSVGSFGHSLTQTWSSNGTSTVAGNVVGATATFAGTTLTPGQYWLALHVSTNNTATGGANTTAITNAISMVLGGSLNSAANLVKAWGAQTNASMGFISGQGILSTGATRATIAFSDYVATGTRAHLAPVAVLFRNGTFQ
jgi:hypothetical protein